MGFMEFKEVMQVVELDKDCLIYIVDDDTDERMFMAGGLHAKGFNNIKHFLNGEQVVRNLRDGKVKPGIIFLDLKLPLIDGFSVLTYIEDIDKQGEIMVCLMSGREPSWYSAISHKYMLLEKVDLRDLGDQAYNAVKYLLSK